MSVTYLGLVLLVWLPGVLQALPCAAPTLTDGYFVPELETYPQGSELLYSCDDGHKPAVEGWWATSTCQNGTWTHVPQCIDEADCVPPEIPNAKYKKSPAGFYKETKKIWITCDEGYADKDKDATAVCVNGSWSSVPDCQKSDQACGQPPRVLHAVIIRRGYQELFPEDAKVQYQCQDGYTSEGDHHIVCTAGNWTEGPQCSRGTGSGTGQGGSTVGGSGGGDVGSAASGTQPAAGGRGTGSGTVQGGSTVGGSGGGDAGSAASGTQPAAGGRGTGSGTVQGGSTAGGSGGGDVGSAASGTQPAAGGRGTGSGAGGTQPASGGTSSTSGSNGREGTQFRPISRCGAYPHVPNAVLVQWTLTSLQYQCVAFYKIVGEGTVMCRSDGTWSQLPVCKAAFCVLNRGLYVGNAVTILADEYLQEGDKKRFQCTWFDWFSSAQCSNGEITFRSCCSTYDINRGVC